jgi:hypothetical protein
MRNGSAAVWQPTSAPTPTWQNPDGDFATTYVNTPHGRFSGRMTMDQIPMLAEGRLSDAANGMFVTVRGIVDSVRVFEHSKSYMPPSAMFRLESGTGAATYVRVSYQAYERIWGFLVMGRQVSLCGTVVIPVPGAPEYIELSRLWLAGSDILTPESYAVQQAAPVLAVAV